MFNILTRMRPRKKQKNTATIAGAMSLAAISGALLTWYAARKMKGRKDNEFLYDRDEESQP
jgi:lysozyme family protein